MARVVSIGAQNFGDIREGGFFYVDKTGFIRDWWDAGDAITLVCRPRRFGKTLTLSTVEHFLSTRFAGRGEELFGGLEIWEDARMRELQGTVPVVMVSFAKSKGPTLEATKVSVKRVLRVAVDDHRYLPESPALTERDRAFLARVSDDMDDETAIDCIGQLCSMLHRHWGTRPVVLLDEYDTPMQEAWLRGYWDGMSDFVRGLFNSAFKTNPALGRALVTGITRVASESIFSDMNNPAVISTTTPQYEEAFGFTQAEVDTALEEFDLAGQREVVREWYDGFTFGHEAHVYNPWSITSYLNWEKLGAHWVNTSSNGLASSVVRRGDDDLKRDFETLLTGGSVVRVVDESVNFQQLSDDPGTVWSLLLATGYLKVDGSSWDPESGLDALSLELTNKEVRSGFDRLIRQWFADGSSSYNGFTRALLAGDARTATRCLNDVTLACMSSFDAAGTASGHGQPERFYHGLVLGLLVELRGRYAVESNRESGYGRYDVMLVPNDGADAAGGKDPAVVIEFKALDPEEGERTLEDSVASAHAQIEERAYAASLVERGIGPERILKYGIAFSGKRALVG